MSKSKAVALMQPRSKGGWRLKRSSLWVYMLVGGLAFVVWVVRPASKELTRPWKQRCREAGRRHLAWVAWPCAALQGAILLASLGSGPGTGVLVMLAFAVASMPGLLAAPWAMRQWRAWRGSAADPDRLASVAFRVGGAGLVMTSGWALTRGIWHSLAAWCGVA